METERIEVQQVAIEDIKEGDVFIGMPHGRPAWTAQEDIVRTTSGAFKLRVQHHPDGGIDYREWSPLSARMMIPVQRG